MPSCIPPLVGCAAARVWRRRGDEKSAQRRLVSSRDGVASGSEGGTSPR